MKSARMLTAFAIAMANLLPACAAEALPTPATTRQIQVVKGADGQFAFRLAEVPVPPVGDHEVLVHVHAVAIQRGDLETLNPASPEDQALLGDRVHIAGSDAAGDIVRVGRLVHSFRPGQRVVALPFCNYVDGPMTAEILGCLHGSTGAGVFGDYVALEETGIALLPEWLSYEEGAALSSIGLTAWAAIGAGNNAPDPAGYLHAGDTVVIEGTGGVSVAALQFAVAKGANVIITSSSDDKLARAKKLGAKQGINYRKTPAWSEQVLALTGGRGADLVLDIGGRATMEQSLNSVAFERTLVAVGGLGGYEASIPSLPVLMKRITVHGAMAGSRADFVRMCQFMEQHRIRPIIERSYPFGDFKKAMEDLKVGNFMGKLVLTL